MPALAACRPLGVREDSLRSVLLLRGGDSVRHHRLEGGALLAPPPPAAPDYTPPSVLRIPDHGSGSCQEGGQGSAGGLRGKWRQRRRSRRGAFRSSVRLHAPCLGRGPRRVRGEIVNAAFSVQGMSFSSPPILSCILMCDFLNSSRNSYPVPVV